MNTDERELTDREIYANKILGEEFNSNYGEPLSPREYLRVRKALEQMRQHPSNGSGNITNGSMKLVWGMLSLFSALVLIWVGWINYAVVDGAKAITAIDAKLEVLLPGYVKQK